MNARNGLIALAGIKAAVAELETERESHYQAIADIDKALTPLQQLLGARGPKPRAKPTKAGRKPDKNRTITGRKRQAPPPAAVGDRSEAILELLRASSPLSPGVITAKLKANRVTIRGYLKKLEKAGRITMTGSTASRLVHLSQAKTPAPARAEKPRPTSDLDPVDARDRAVLAKIREQGAKGLSTQELSILMPDEAIAALGNAVDRLRIKQRIRAVDGKWIAAA